MLRDDFQPYDSLWLLGACRAYVSSSCVLSSNYVTTSTILERIVVESTTMKFREILTSYEKNKHRDNINMHKANMSMDEWAWTCNFINVLFTFFRLFFFQNHWTCNNIPFCTNWLFGNKYICSYSIYYWIPHNYPHKPCALASCCTISHTFQPAVNMS